MQKPTDIIHVSASGDSDEFEVELNNGIFIRGDWTSRTIEGIPGVMDSGRVRSPQDDEEEIELSDVEFYDEEGDEIFPAYRDKVLEDVKSWLRGYK